MIEKYFNIDILIQLNKFLTEDNHQIIDYSKLESCFSSYMYYNTEEEKVISVYRSIILNHCFLDGNKRTAFLFLETCYDILGISELYEFTSIPKVEKFLLTCVNKKLSVEGIIKELNKLKHK